jgi:hypothetical protein
MKSNVYIMLKMFMLCLLPTVTNSYLVDFSSNTSTTISDSRAEMIVLRDKLEFMIFECEEEDNSDGKEMLEEFLEELNNDLSGDDCYE